jgi:hypothetical protein
MSRHSQPVRRPIIRHGLGLILILIATASSAHAHGGMAGPDELGPPLFTSAALAFVCYWIVILWPSSKRKGSGDAPSGQSMTTDKVRQGSRLSQKRTAPNSTAHLRTIASNRTRRGTVSGRKVSDV